MRTLFGVMALSCAMTSLSFADPINIFLDNSNGQTTAPTALGSTGGFTSTSWIFGEVDALPNNVGTPMYENGVGVTNIGPGPVTASLFTGIWAVDGAGGGPGTLLDIANTNAIPLPTGNFFFFVWSNFAVPSGKFWMGFALDNQRDTSTTAAQLSQLQFDYGQSPSIGTSSRTALLGSGLGWIGSNPTISSDLGSYNAQFIQVLTPEPATLYLSFGAVLMFAGLYRRRR